MLIGLYCLLNMEMVFHRTVPQSGDSTCAVLTDGHAVFVPLCKVVFLESCDWGYLISDDAFLFKDTT